MKVGHCTVGKVAIAPFEIEYGKGHSLIMTSNFRPSCLSVSAKAVKRRSLATIRVTQADKIWREARKEAVEPRMVADATMNQL